MKGLLGGLLTGIALCAANFTVCAETEQIDLKALAKKAQHDLFLAGNAQHVDDCR
jgi:hypothetical protein